MIVPEAVWPASLVIVTVISTSKVAGGRGDRAFSCAWVLAVTQARPAETSWVL